MKVHLWERCFNTFRAKKLKLGGVRVLVAWLMLSGAEGKCRDSPLHKYQDLLLGILVKCCTIEQKH